MLPAKEHSHEWIRASTFLSSGAADYAPLSFPKRIVANCLLLRFIQALV